jgi:Xaa-Pro aminopeptidase
MSKPRRLGPLVAVALGCAAGASAQLAPESRPDPSRGSYQADFPPEELRARWAAVFQRIGNEAVAVAQGAPLTSGFQLPRQANTFYYLCGIETPGAYLLLDGRTRRVTLYLPSRNERLERSEGKVLSAEDAELVRRVVGVDEVRAVADMGTSWPAGDAKVALYAEHAPAEGHAQSRHEVKAADAAIASDPWDGRLPRETRFVELLRLRNPRASIQDLTPILDEMRSVKSPRETALVRRASQLAGLGVLEAMRSTEPGAWEYQLDAAARYVFLQNGARQDGYRSITASGTENIWNAHYYRNESQLRAGDLVLMDYAPDYRYYVSDIGRMWPVSGTYAPWQRELLQFVLEWRNAVLARIRPGVTTDAILAEARTAMEPVLARTRFSKPEYEGAARKMLETSGGVFSHPVGMAVHDVGSYREGPLKPGQVFAVDPQLWVPEEKLYVRYEDTVVVTETGVENFTAFLPVELDAIEAVVRGKGILQSLPALTEAGFEALRAGRR